MGARELEKDFIFMLCVRSVSLDVLVSGFLLSMEMYKFLNIFLYITGWDKNISSNKERIVSCSDFAFLGAHIPDGRQTFGWSREGQVSCIKGDVRWTGSGIMSSFPKSLLVHRHWSLKQKLAAARRQENGRHDGQSCLDRASFERTGPGHL